MCFNGFMVFQQNRKKRPTNKIETRFKFPNLTLSQTDFLMFEDILLFLSLFIFKDEFKAQR